MTGFPEPPRWTIVEADATIWINKRMSALRPWVCLPDPSSWRSWEELLRMTAPDPPRETDVLLGWECGALLYEDGSQCLAPRADPRTDPLTSHYASSRCGECGSDSIPLPYLAPAERAVPPGAPDRGPT